MDKTYNDILVINLTKFMPEEEAIDKLKSACSDLGFSSLNINDEQAEKLAIHFINSGGRMSFIGRALKIVLITNRAKQQ